MVGDAAVQSGLAVYFVATVSFVKIGFVIQGMLSARHGNDLIVAAIRRINLVNAAVSIVVTQCTLLTMESVLEAQSSSAIFGMACSIAFVILGLVMLRRIN